MFKCTQCPSVFNRKNNLTVHQKKHAGVRFPCPVCVKSFNVKSNLNRHLKCVHGVVDVNVHLRPIPSPQIVRPAPVQPVQLDQPARQSVIQYAHRSGGSNVISEDEIIPTEVFERNELLKPHTYIHNVGGRLE